MWLNNKIKLEYLLRKQMEEFRGKQSEQQKAEAFIRKLVQEQSKKAHEQVLREMKLLKFLKGNK